MKIQAHSNEVLTVNGKYVDLILLLQVNFSPLWLTEIRQQKITCFENV